MRIWTAFFALLLFPLLATSQSCFSDRYQGAVFQDVSIYKNIIYAQAVPYENQSSAEVVDLKFDFYEPTDDTLRNRPLVLMLAGGDFQKGGKENSEVKTYCDSLAKYGYACAALDFRLGYNARNPESVERAIYRSVQDARSAVRFFKENKLTFKIDTTRIYLGGDESGAITALYTAYINDESLRPKSTFGIPGESYDLGCLDCVGNPFEHVVDVAGVINLRGELTQELLDNAVAKIPVVHIEEDPALLAPIDMSNNPLKNLNLQPPSRMYDQMTERGLESEVVVAPLLFGSGYTTSANSAVQIWDAIWFDVSNFLYNTLSFISSEPEGSVLGCSGKTETYKVEPKVGYHYCWDVEGGRIIKNTGHEIEVIWNYNVDKGKVTLIEKSETEVVGQPTTLEVDLRATPQADFSVNKIQDNVVLVTDQSAYGTFFTIDFGDDSAPVSGKSGSSTNHTYLESGEFTITQVIENTCGISINTREVKIPVVVKTEGTKEEQVIIYPNPARQNESISINLLNTIDSESMNIKIVDAAGKVWLTQEITEGLTSYVKLDTQKLPKGAYKVEVELGEDVVKKDLIIE